MNSLQHKQKLLHGFNTLLKLIESHETLRSANNGQTAPTGEAVNYELKTDTYKPNIAFWQTLLDMCDRLDLSNYEITPEQEMCFISARETIRLEINDADINKKIKMSYNGEHEISPAYVIREVLSQIKDLQDPDRWPQIEFLKVETELHKTISADLDEVVNSLRIKNWKSATVVSASIIEAVCSWWIKDQTGNLADLLKKCQQKKLFSSNSHHRLDSQDEESFYQSAMCAKNYRNLIHADKAKRTETQCDEGTAHQAYGVLLRVLDAMSNKPQP